MRENIIAQRWLIWITIALTTLYGVALVFLSGFVPPPSPSLTADQVVRLYSDHNGMVRIAVVLCLIGGGFNASWTAVIAIQMRRCESGMPVWTVTQVIGGALSTILFPFPALLWGIAAFTVTRDPEITQAIHEAAFLTLITPVSFFWVQALPIAVISLSRHRPAHSPFPRWLGYFTVWMLASAEVGALAQLFKRGPFAWNGIFPFWIPLVMFAIWFVTISVLILRALDAQATDGSGQGAAPDRSL